MLSGEEYIKTCIAEGEHQQQDFKFEISDARKIAKTLVAFANTDGGRLLIGVKDNGRIAGVRSDEEYYMIEGAAGLFCKPEIPFKSNTWIVEGKSILEIIIEPSEEKPHYAKDENGKWLAYHRVDDNNFLVNYILLQVWKRAKRKQGTFIAYSENEKQVLDHLQTEGKCLKAELSARLGIKSKVLNTILINLVSLKAVRMHFIENEVYYTLYDGNTLD